MRTGNTWSGTFGQIPAGSNRIFSAEAYDSSSTMLYRGEATGVSIQPAATVVVALTLQQVSPPAPFNNAAPCITALIASDSAVIPGGTLTLQATASDPDPGQTLTYAWSATAGTFSNAASGSTSWTAPSTPGTVSLRLKVTDPLGASTEATLTLSVQQASGNATLNVLLNTWPEVSLITGSPTRIDVGQSTTLSATARDADGDALTYAWSASCAGTFDTPTAASSRFTPTALPASNTCGNCTLTVTIQDGRGGQNSGQFSLCVAPPLQALFPPRIISTFQSSTSPQPGQTLLLGVRATDPQGSALTFTWQASQGVLATPSSSADRSEVSWTAPACLGPAAFLRATVTNALGLNSSAVFSLAGLPPCAPTIQPTAALATARTYHVLTLLPSGKVLATGSGWFSASEASAELYEPGSRTWSTTGPMASSRGGHTATLLPNGKVLVTGGWTGPGYWSGHALNTAELYDPATGTFTPTGPMNAARAFHTATLLPSGKVLLAGGGTSVSTVETTAELYDPGTGVFTLVGAMRQGHGSHTATLLLSGKVLIAGGLSQPGVGSAASELYDPATRSFTATGSMAARRTMHSTTLLPSGKVLAAGGQSDNNGTPLTSAELYDPATETWSSAGQMPHGHGDHAAVPLPSGAILIMGNAYNSANFNELYWPDTGSWQSTTAFQYGHSRSAVMLPNGQVLAAGGPVQASVNAELFLP